MKYVPCKRHYDLKFITKAWLAVLSKQNMYTGLIKNALLFFCVLLQACYSHFSGEVDEHVSDSYYYIKETGEIVYFPGGDLTDTNYKMVDADKATFRPIARDFGKDKNHTFYKAEKLPQVDYSSLVGEEATFKKEEVYAIHRFDIEAFSDTRSNRYARTGKAYFKNHSKDY